MRMILSFCVKTLAAFLMISSIITTANATSIILRSIERMSQRSDIICVAEMISQQVTKGRQGQTVTLSTMKVLEAIKGVKEKGEFTLYQVGGQIAGQGYSWIPGVSRYSKGEKVFFFGQKMRNYFIAYNPGKFSIQLKDGVEIVQEELNGMSVMRNERGDRLQSGGGEDPRYDATLEQLRKQVIKALTFSQNNKGTTNKEQKQPVPTKIQAVDSSKSRVK